MYFGEADSQTRDWPALLPLRATRYQAGTDSLLQDTLEGRK